MQSSAKQQQSPGIRFSKEIVETRQNVSEEVAGQRVSVLLLDVAKSAQPGPVALRGIVAPGGRGKRRTIEDEDVGGVFSSGGGLGYPV